MTELIDDNHTENNSKQRESLEIQIQNLRNRVNLIDNKSRAKNISLIMLETNQPKILYKLITKVTQIMHDVYNKICTRHPCIQNWANK